MRLAGNRYAAMADLERTRAVRVRKLQTLTSADWSNGSDCMDGFSTFPLSDGG